MKYDKFQLIVIGAGTGGCTIAHKAAKSGLSVVLIGRNVDKLEKSIDKREKKEIGKKLTYDTIPSYVFDDLGLAVPQGDEIDMVMKKLKIFSPSRRYYFETDLSAYLIHRLKFGQRLLRYALENNVTLHTQTEYREPIVEDGFVVGVRCRAPGGEQNEYRGLIVCDASGYPAVVRNSLPDSVYQNEILNQEDVIQGYREIRDILAPSDTIPDREYPGWYCYLQDRGYAWIAPENNGRGNIGCGVPLSSDNLDPELMIKEYCNSHPEHFGTKVYAEGTGPTPYLPVRTCQPELVANGFMVIGDAACQASPVSAFGMAGSLIAGKVAAETAVSAIQKKDVSRKVLWKYNVRYKRGIGSRQAFIDPMRIFLQNTSNHDLDILVKRGLLGPEEFSLVWTDQTFAYSLYDLIKKFFKGFPYIFLLLKLRFVYIICKKMEKHYQQFPASAGDFESWKIKRKAIYHTLFRKLKIKREI